MTPPNTVNPAQIEGTPVSIATSADHLSWGFGWRPMPKLAFTGDVGFAFAHAEQNNPAYGVFKGDGATLFEWNFTVVLPDLFKEGNVGTVMVGNPYRVIKHGSGEQNVKHSFKPTLTKSTSYESGILIQRYVFSLSLKCRNNGWV